MAPGLTAGDRAQVRRWAAAQTAAFWAPSERERASLQQVDDALRAAAASAAAADPPPAARS
jgi:hypothetical protein